MTERKLELDGNSALVFVDCETTGVHPKVDYIVQLAFIKLHVDGKETEWATYVKPPIPIPPEVIAVHGITDDMVKDAPTFAALAPVLKERLTMCDLAGYNGDFDYRMLRAEFARCGIQGFPNGRLLDPKMVYFARHPRDLYAAVREYLGDERAEAFKTIAHDAAADIRATYDILRAQLQRYPDLPCLVGDLHRTMFPPDPDGLPDNFYRRYGQPTFGFGKYIGEAVSSVARKDPRYLDWMLGQDFAPEVKRLIRDALGRK